MNPFKGDFPDIYIYIRDGNPNTKIHNPTKFLSIFFKLQIWIVNFYDFSNLKNDTAVGLGTPIFETKLIQS